MFTPIQTARLLLRPFREGDLQAFVDYRNDPEVARFQSWDSISAEKAWLFIEEVRRARPGIPGEWYQVAIALRATDELIGDIGLGTDASDPFQAEIGFTLSRPHQGKGYGTEAVSALIEYAFTNLDISCIVGICDARNTSSSRLMERVGMKFISQTQNVFFKGQYCDENHYAIERGEWTRRVLRTED